MTRMNLIGVALLTVGLTAAARCDITVDEARRIAEKHAGHSLAGGRVTDRDLEVVHAISIDDPVTPEVGRTYSVDLTHGTFDGWFQSSDGAPPDAQPTLSDEEVLRIAKAALAEHMGPAAADVEWRLREESDNVVKYYCPGPRLGDPPRSGLSASGSVEVSRRNGAIMWLSVDMPWSTTPVPVNVSEEEAIRIAKTAVKLDWPPSDEPLLVQRGDRVTWYVRLGRKGGQEKTCDIDAATGKVLSTSSMGSARPSGHTEDAPPTAGAPGLARPSATSTPSGDDGLQPASAVPAAPASSQPAGTARTLVIAVASTALVLCAGSALLLLRRRR